jgi:hypothetical protein
VSIAAWLTACEVTRVTPESDGDDGGRSIPDASAATRDASQDASTAAPQPDAAMMSVDAGGVTPWVPQFPLSGSTCSLAVAARCDGEEDCGEGQVCCGVFDPVRFTYASIGCADSCPTDGNHFALCHPGESCSDPGLSCRRSLLIGYEFISVCAGSVDVPGDATGEPIAGEIACGESTCRAGSEKCCLRARYEFFDLSAHTLDPYCMAIDSPEDACDCDAVPPARPDAGAPDAGGGGDDDAGAD